MCEIGDDGDQNRDDRVLLMNPETGPVTPTVAANCLRRSVPANTVIFRPINWTRPVRLIPVLRMSIASTVIVVGLATPRDSLSWRDLCPRFNYHQ